MVDSHCHLADEVFAADLGDVVVRAHEAGVRHALCILAAGDAREAGQAARLEALWPSVRFAVGVHPHQAKGFVDRPERAADLVRTQATAVASVGAVGEIGLDYHYDLSPRDVQRDVFAAQLRLARELDLPVVIHTREAEDDTFAILEAEGGGRLRGIFHCFTGDAAMARRGLDIGFHVSFAGIVTTGCSPKRTVPFWRRCRIVASATSPPGSPGSPPSSPRSGAPTPGACTRSWRTISSACCRPLAGRRARHEQRKSYLLARA